MGGELLPTKDAAAVVGVHYSTLSRYRRRGCPHEKGARGYVWDPARVRAWMRLHGQGKTGKRLGPMGDVSEELKAAELRKREALASRYEHRNQVERGLYHRVDDCAARAAREIRSVRSVLLSLAGRMAPRLVGLTAEEIRCEIEDAVSEALRGLSGGSSTL